MIHLSQTNTRSFDELVFDHRNQAYGAYVLRREYPRQVLKSLLIGIVIMASILAIPYLAERFKKEKVVEKSTLINTTCELKKVDEKKVDPPKMIQEKKQPPSGPTIRWTVPVVVDVTDDSLLTITELEPVNPGKYNYAGPGGFEGIGGGDGPENPLGEEPEIQDAIAIPDPPSFPGGDEAMRKFLSENLVYPQHARDIGLEGKVYVTFIVDQFGNLVQIETPRPLGGGLDEEAVRVMKIMPRWKPGRQNGHPVKVRFNLPIVFQLD